MDLHPIAKPPSSEEIEAVDAAIDGTSRDQLLPALRAIQMRCGWISPGGLGYVAERLHLPPAEVYGVATFYHLLSLKPEPGAMVHLCDDIACRAHLENLKPQLTTAFGDHQRPSPCLGLCEQAPAALVTLAGEKPLE